VGARPVFSASIRASQLATPVTVLRTMRLGDLWDRVCQGRVAALS
jgi:hypothetical protein